MKTYLYPTIEIVRIETQSIICTSDGEQMNISGTGSLGGARAPQRREASSSVL